MRHDAGGIVVGWLTRVAIAIALVGVVAFESLSIFVARMDIQDTAADAASAAQTTWSSSPNAQAAYTAAETAAEASGATIPPKSFVVHPDGSLRFVITKTAPTLLLHDIGPLAQLAKVRYTYHAAALMGTGSSP